MPILYSAMRTYVGSYLIILPLDMPLPLMRWRTAFSRVLQFFLWLPQITVCGAHALCVFHGIHLEGMLWHSLARHGQWRPCVPS